MAATFYPQMPQPQPSTLTVEQLIEHLERVRSLCPGAPVAFRSPIHGGGYGPGIFYTIDVVEPVALPREETHYTARMGEDEETGEPVELEAWTEVRHAWTGVVLG